MTDLIDQLREGTLGYFWPVYQDGTRPDLDYEKAIPGFIKGTDEGIELVLLRDDPITGSWSGKPYAFIGTTEHSGILLS